MSIAAPQFCSSTYVHTCCSPTERRLPSRPEKKFRTAPVLKASRPNRIVSLFSGPVFELGFKSDTRVRSPERSQCFYSIAPGG